MTATAEMKRIAQEMTNFDHTINVGFEDALRDQPGEVYGIYNGWKFNGRVWYADGVFHCEPWVHHVPQELITNNTLAGIMEGMSSAYGYD